MPDENTIAASRRFMVLKGGDRMVRTIANLWTAAAAFCFGGAIGEVISEHSENAIAIALCGVLAIFIAIYMRQFPPE